MPKLNAENIAAALEFARKHGRLDDDVMIDADFQDSEVTDGDSVILEQNGLRIKLLFEVIYLLE